MNLFFQILIQLQLINQKTEEENLVLNGDFENFKSCPTYYTPFTLSNWYSTDLSTPDYYNNNRNLNYVYFNDASEGKFPAYSGNGYVGIIPIAPNGYMEHIQELLKTKLEKGIKYKISFYVFFVSSVSFFSTYKIGTLVSKNKILNEDLNVGFYQFNMLIGNTATIENPKDSFLVDRKWKLIEGYFIAKGDERYITLGAFYENDKVLECQAKKYLKKYATKNNGLLPAIKSKLLRSNVATDKDNINYFGEVPYYLIDDVKLVPIREKIK